MARFVFHLEGVLRQRKQVERDRQRVLAERLAIVARLSAELREMDAQVQRAVEDIRQNRLTGPIDLSFLAAHRRYTQSMQRRAVEQARRIVSAQQSADAARAELAEAARQRKVIEKLKERRFSLWKAEQDRKEMAELDEIGMRLAYDSAVADPSLGPREID